MKTNVACDASQDNTKERPDDKPETSNVREHIDIREW